MVEFNSDVEAADALASSYQKLKQEIGKKIVGQDETVEQLLLSIFCQGHSLLIGVPGLAKTLLIQTLSEALDLNFNRIQFTPDLMPSDILGAETLDNERNFRFIKGPIFSNIILADEINRTPPKTQAALLESMQEYSVTIAGKRYPLERPFFVLATQNPIEQEGTYPLPEAQLDRFMFKIELKYLTEADEVTVVSQTTQTHDNPLSHPLGGEDILEFQRIARQVPAAEAVIQYAVRLVHASRPQSDSAPDFVKDWVSWGAGIRASQNLILAGKVRALLHGRYNVSYGDVRALAPSVLRHRVLLNFHAEAERITTDIVIEKLLDAVPEPSSTI